MLASGMVASPEDQKRFITMIGVEVDRLIDLINDILKLSELESVTIPRARSAPTCSPSPGTPPLSSPPPPRPRRSPSP